MLVRFVKNNCFASPDSQLLRDYGVEIGGVYEYDWDRKILVTPLMKNYRWSVPHSCITPAEGGEDNEEQPSLVMVRLTHPVWLANNKQVHRGEFLKGKILDSGDFEHHTGSIIPSHWFELAGHHATAKPGKSLSEELMEMFFPSAGS